MEWSSRITPSEHSGCQENSEMPLNPNYFEFRSGNAASGSQSCLDLLTGLHGASVVSGSEGMFGSTNTLQRWSQVRSSSLREAIAQGGAAGSSSQFVFSSANGNRQETALHFGHGFPVNGGGRALPRSHNMGSVSWNSNYGICYPQQTIRGATFNGTAAQFNPATPVKNKVIVGGQHIEVIDLDDDDEEEEGINETASHQKCISGMRSNKSVKQCSVKHSSYTDNMISSGSFANFQVSEKNMVYNGSSVPETPDKHGSQHRSIRESFEGNGQKENGNVLANADHVDITPDKYGGQHISLRESSEGNEQKENGNVLSGTDHVGITPDSCLDPSSQQEVQTLAVEDSLAANEQTTPQQQQKPRRRKHRPKVVIEGEKAKKKKVVMPKPVDTPEVPRVKRKYVRKPRTEFPENLYGVSTPENARVKRKYERKKKKDLPETLEKGDGELPGDISVTQTARRSLNFNVEEGPPGFLSKNPDAESNCQADSWNKQNNDGNVQTAPQNVIDNTYCHDQNASLNASECSIQPVSQNVHHNVSGSAHCNVQSVPQNVPRSVSENAYCNVGSISQNAPRNISENAYCNIGSASRNIPRNISENAYCNVGSFSQNVPHNVSVSAFCNAKSVPHSVPKGTNCSIQNVSQRVFESTRVMVNPSIQIASGSACLINNVPEKHKSQGYVIQTPRSARRNILKENLKTLARNRDDLEKRAKDGDLSIQGSRFPFSSATEIKKSKRSKRERNDAATNTGRSNFGLQNGFNMVPAGGTSNSIYNFSVPFIPEQCKRKRTKAGPSEQDRNALSLPLSNRDALSGDGQNILACMPAEEGPRHIQTEIKFGDSSNLAFVPAKEAPTSNRYEIKFCNSSSSQVQKDNLLVQANAMCFSQLPPIARSISYYQNLASSGPKALIEGTSSKAPRRKTTKKVQTQANGMPSGFSSQSSTVRSSLSLHNSTFSQTSFLQLVDFLAQKLICLNINGVPGEVPSQGIQQDNALVIYNGGGAMVPFDNLSILPKKKKPRARVDLDAETNRVWLILMGAVNVEAPEGTDAEKEKWWEEERRVFQGRAESFIARMHLVQGDRRFSPWKGSVVDSVVGVFLTQNVSDHLSSSAFMNLTARFPIRTVPACFEVKRSTVNGDAYIVELDVCMEGEEKIQGLSAISLDTMAQIPEDAPGREDKEISQHAHSKREDPLVSSNSTTTMMHVPQVTVESPNSEDLESIKSFDGTSINLNLVVSEQNSSDCSIKKNDITGLGLQSNFDMATHLLDDNRYNLNASTSFMGLLQLAGSNMLHFLPRETSSDVLYEQEFCTQDMKNTISNGIYKNEDPSPPSTGTSYDFYLSKQQNSSGGVEYFSSSQNVYHSDYHDKTMEKPDVRRENISSSFATTVRVADRFGIENSCICSSTKNTSEATGQEASLLTSHITSSWDSHTKLSNHSDGSQGEVHSDQNSCNHNSPPSERDISFPNSNFSCNYTIPLDCSTQESFTRKDCQAMIREESTQAPNQVPGYKAQESRLGMHQNPSTFIIKELSCTTNSEVKTSTITDSKSQDQKNPKEIAVPEKPKRKRTEKTPVEPIDWDQLRKEACTGDVKKERSRETMDSVDWEAIRRADVSELSDAIRERGMNNRLAERIKEFLDRLVKDHGSIDLEWLRDAPPDKVKNYLLSIKGLGLKSVECVRLLTLHHLAFPVDTNVGRICVRLGWVPLQPLPESLQLHLLELYPMLETIQKYLWPRLCNLDQRTLYELHYQMITFGKVFCTKSKPNCNACPMRGECKHFASAFASARLALPGPEEKGLVPSDTPIPIIQEPRPNIKVMALPQPENSPLQEECTRNNCEPIIEEPSTPEPECLEAPQAEIEDLFYEDPDEIPTIKLNIEKFAENLQNIMQQNNLELQEADISKALVALTPDAASIPQPKLKNISRLRTEHQVYELPDSHPLVKGLDQRETDDPSPYLLAIWSPGETAQSMDLPQVSCSSQETGTLCDRETCPSCNAIRETRAQIVRGTLLIPCRTAMRGSFPLNGTYFQVNEVFADHSSSLKPIDIPRQWIWNLSRRTVYFGTSVPTIFKGMTTEAIQQCFWRGFVCVRGFDRETRAPRPLMARLHFPASKVVKNKKVDATEQKAP